MMFTIYKEIQIGFGKLLSQYKQKTDEINISLKKYLENWHSCLYVKCE